MNRKGGIFLTVIIAIIIFMIGMLMINFIDPQIDVFLGTNGLNCDDTTISDGSKFGCLIGELTIPLFILTIISITGGAIIGRLL